MKRMTLAALLLAATAFAQVVPAVQAPAAPAVEGTVAHDAPASALGDHAEAPAGETAPHSSDHAESAHEGHHGPGAIRWLPTDEGTGVPYVYMLINFAVLMAIYVKAGKRPVVDALEKRRTDFLAKVEEADRLRREAEARAEKYQSKLASLEHDLAAARAALEEAGKAEHARIVADAHDRAERMKRDAAFIVSQEERAMRDELQRRTVDAAIDGAAKLLASSVTTTDQERIAESFLQSLSSTSLRSGASQT